MSTPPPSIPWDDIRLFLAVYRAGSLTGAAKTLRVNQATVSRRLADLEARLGQTLFVRLPRGVAPTAVADAMLDHAEQADMAVHACLRQAITHEADVQGTVRVATLESIAIGLIAPQLPSLFARYPRLRVELVASTEISDLTRREADLALRVVRPRSGELVAKRVALLKHGVYAPPGEALPEALTDRPWVSLDDALGHTPLPRWLRAHVPDAHVALTASGLELVAAAVAAGVGLAILPSALAKAWGLKEVPVPFARPETPLWLVGHASLRDVPRIAAVWDFLDAVVAAMP